MKPDDFRGTPAGRLVKTVDGVWAFVPHPLPPPLVFDEVLVRELSAADRALGELAGVGAMLTNPHLLIRPFLHREAVLSSRIEGTRASLNDVFGYEAVQLPLPYDGPPASVEDVREVANYVAALEYGLERLATLPLSCRLLRELHERLLAGVRGADRRPGEFRDGQNYIAAPGDPIQAARYVPPPVREMYQALDAFERFLNEPLTVPPLVWLALVHYQFEAIHPFVDGNGRIGRLLITLLLCQRRLLPQPLLYLSAFFEQHRQAYYDRLLAVSQRGAWNEWLAFFLRGVALQARDAINRSRRLLHLQQQYRKRLQHVRASASPLRLVDELFARPMLTIPQAQGMLGVTYRAAQLNVEKLVDAGVLRELRPARHLRLFVADEILRALDEPLEESEDQPGEGSMTRMQTLSERRVT